METTSKKKHFQITGVFAESEFGTPLTMFRRTDPGHHIGCDDDELIRTLPVSLGRASQQLGGYM